jgi:hypothetical protein
LTASFLEPSTSNCSSSAGCASLAGSAAIVPDQWVEPPSPSSSCNLEAVARAALTTMASGLPRWGLG